MKQNENTKNKRRWYEITPKTIKKIYIEMFRLYPIICNLYILSLVIEWWVGYDCISKYIYPFIGDSFYIIVLFYFGSFVHRFCGIYRYYLANMFIWLFYEFLFLQRIEIPQFIIIISLTTFITFIATLIIIIRQWRKKTKTAKT